MLRTRIRRTATLLATALCIGAAPGHAADSAATEDRLIELKGAEALDTLMTEPGVVLVDYFADW